VKFSAKARGIEPRSSRDRLGTVVGGFVLAPIVSVRWDGKAKCSRYHTDFLDIVDPLAESTPPIAAKGEELIDDEIENYPRDEGYDAEVAALLSEDD